ncbi:MAG: hypothetical protein AB7W16_29645 [Candidatus Obscuribacterales bacterium]
MSEMINERDQMIEDALNDLLQDDTDDNTEETTTETETTETAETEAETSTETTDESTVVEPKTETETSQTETVVEDDFSKRFGLSEKTVTGRENRIPYSRVKKIIEKNERELKEKLSKELEGQYKPKLSDFETKVKDYEDRLQKVGQFEQVMANDPQTFLGILSQIPAYKPFFDYLNQVASAEKNPEKTATAATTTQVPTGDDPADPRPGPNKTLADGSKVYDLEGHQALMDWYERRAARKAAEEATRRVNEELSKRLAPVEQEQRQRAEERQRQETLTRNLAIVEKQLADARTWPMFNEHEEAITKALEADKTLSLEGAYRQVVLPKLIENANSARTKVLTEMKRQPASTAVPTRPATKPAPGLPKDRDAMILAELQKQGLI